MPRTATLARLVNTSLVKSLYYYRSRWLSFDQDGDFVQGPLHNDHLDRVYCTFQASPPAMFKHDGLGIDDNGNATIELRRLGVPVPEASPSVSVSGGTGDPIEARTYGCTFISDLGEEGEISPASTVVDIKKDSTVSVSLPIPPEGWNITKKRLYRSNAGSTDTQFQFVAELDASEVSFNDSISSDKLGEVLPTEGFVPPPEDMEGLIALPNGVMAGFSGGRTICLCEPFQPHAWPVKYQLSTNYDIVGLGHIGTTLVVLTDSLVYLISCSDPATAAMDSFDDIVPCVSKRGIVSSRWGVIFPSTQGLVAVGLSGTELITRDLFTRREWERLKPETFTAFVHSDKYIAFHRPDEGGKGFVFDPVEPASRLVDISTHAVAGHIRPEDDLCLAVPSGPDHVILSWAQNELSPHTFQWRSKDFRTPHALNFSTAKVMCDPPDLLTAEEWADQRADIVDQFEGELVSGEIGGAFNEGLLGDYAMNGDKTDIVNLKYSPPKPTTFRLYGDGVLRHTQKVEDPYPFRLPGGYAAQSWEIEVVGARPVKELHLATSVAEVN